MIISPCISICKTDPLTGYCYGCGRTNDDKKKWKSEETTNEWKEKNGETYIQKFRLPSEAEWEHEDNTIYIYFPNMKDEEHVIRSILHEFEHTHQDPKKHDEYRALGYDKNPYEIAAYKAEEKWKKYL